MDSQHLLSRGTKYTALKLLCRLFEADHQERNLCDLTNHAEMVLLHGVSRQLQEMGEDERHDLTLYVTLEPCLMCSAALSVAGIKRIVYAALSEDANDEQMIVQNLTLPKINQQLIRGPFTLVPGVRRAEGQELLRRMNKAADAPADLKT